MAIDLSEVLRNLEAMLWVAAHAALIAVIGLAVVKGLLVLFVRILKRGGTDEMVIAFSKSIVKAVLLLILTILVLNNLGADTTSLVAILGAGGLAISLALQDSMKNFAAGFLLLVFRPFAKGDFVEAGGTTGLVQTVSLFSTLLLTRDHREVIVPNGMIWGNVITNFTSRDLRRLDLVFGIGYDDDVRKAREIVEEVLENSRYVLDTPPSIVAVAELADNSVNFDVQPWVKSDDLVEAKYEITEAIKLAFDDRGISIPFPQLDLHVSGDATSAAANS